MRVFRYRNYPQANTACRHCRTRGHSDPLVVRLGNSSDALRLYNVSGFDAVAITLRDGRKFALGTNDPGGLTAAIQLSRGGRTGPQPVNLRSLPGPGKASPEKFI